MSPTWEGNVEVVVRKVGLLEDAVAAGRGYWEMLLSRVQVAGGRLWLSLWVRIVEGFKATIFLVHECLESLG